MMISTNIINSTEAESDFQLWFTLAVHYIQHVIAECWKITSALPRLNSFAFSALEINWFRACQNQCSTVCNIAYPYRPYIMMVREINYLWCKQIFVSDKSTRSAILLESLDLVSFIWNPINFRQSSVIITLSSS